MKITNLILKSQEGNNTEVLELIENFRPLIRKYSRHNYIEDLEAILVEHLIRVVLYMPIRKEGQNINYITTSLKNKFLNEIKKNYKLRDKEISLDDILINNFSISTDTNNIFFSDIISVLDSKKRDIILLRYWYGYSDIEISNKLNISRQTINKILRQAYKIIKTTYLKEKEDF